MGQVSENHKYQVEMDARQMKGITMKIRKLLLELEWSKDVWGTSLIVRYCPYCKASKKSGHLDGCELSSAIKEVKKT